MLRCDHLLRITTNAVHVHAFRVDRRRPPLIFVQIVEVGQAILPMNRIGQCPKLIGAVADARALRQRRMPLNHHALVRFPHLLVGHAAG